MPLTLPSSNGGIVTYDSSGDVILRSGNDQVEIYVSLVVDGSNTVGGVTTLNDTLHVNADSDFNGNVAIGDKISFTAGTGALVMGALTLNGPLDADGQTIDGAAITGSSLSTGTGNIVISDDTISLGTSSLSFDGLGAVFSARVVAANIQSGGSLTAAGTFSHAGAAFGVFGASPTGKPNVTGSRGGNVALADLLGSLADLGIITDSSSA